MSKNNENSAQRKKTSIGGQALIEGLMMLGPEKKAIAARLPNGQIALQVSERAANKALANIPFIRGPIRLVTQMSAGINALMKSADLQEEKEAELEDFPTEDSLLEEAVAEIKVEPLLQDMIADPAESTAKPEKPEKLEEPAMPARAAKKSKKDSWLDKHANIVMAGTVAVAIAFSTIIFILLPSVITDGIKALLQWRNSSFEPGSLILSLLEGFIRIIIFLAYLWSSSKMGEIKRVWMYHGAEHKAIAAYEAGEELVVENVKKYSRFHPRCGTAFMFLVMLVSILVFAFVGRHGALINLLLRIALLPLVAGISYEITRLAGYFDNHLTRLISLPGLALQRMTTSEPDEGMLEVAIAAIEAVIPNDPSKDQW